MNELLLAYLCSFSSTHARSEDGTTEAVTENFEGLRSWGEDLMHDDPGTREAAAEALLRIGEDAVPCLLELLNDPEERIRDLAQAVLDKMGVEAV